MIQFCQFSAVSEFAKHVAV